MGFRALLLEEQDGKVTQTFPELADDDLPEGDVLVKVNYSDLNYKDGLILNGLARLVRNYPHIPGIDFSGVVESSDSPDYQPGDEVLLTGWGLGERYWGGYAQKARVKSDWLVKIPDGLDQKRAMALGTAGFTSMLAVMALEDHGLSKDGGEVLVTGAAGGLGSVAVAILANLGYTVAASTGRAETHDYLKSLGATTLVDRKELSESSGKPLDTARWQSAIDTVGGATLGTVLTQIKLNGCISVCGNAGGNELNTTVLPFILRGVNMLGIDSVMCPRERRRTAWRRLANELPMDKLDDMTTVAALGDLPELGSRILKGQVQGRTVIDVNQ